MTGAGISLTDRGIDIRLAAAAALLAALCAYALGQVWHGFPPDLSAIWMAGHLFASGQFDLIYAAPAGFFGSSPPDWQPLLPALGLQGRDVLPYVYPPLWAALVAPLAAVLGPQAFFQAAAVAEIAMLVGSVLVAWRLCRGFAVPLWAWILASAALIGTSVISFTALMHLQPQIVVVFLTLLAFERHGAGRTATAGAILAAAAALKLAPAALALIFLFDRDARALAGFALTGAAFALLSLALAGPALHFAFLDSMGAASAGLFVTSITYSAEVLAYGAAALLGLAPEVDGAARNFRVEVPGALALLTRAAGLALLVWMIAATRALDPARRLPARLFLLSLLVNLFGPLGWVHYYLPQLLMLPALAGLLPAARGAALAVGAATLTSWPVLLALRPALPGDFAIAALGTGTMLILFAAVTAKVRA